LDLGAITRCEAARLGDDRQACHRLLQHLALARRTIIGNQDIFPANTMAYDRLMSIVDFIHIITHAAFIAIIVDAVISLMPPSGLPALYSSPL